MRGKTLWNNIFQCLPRENQGKPTKTILLYGVPTCSYVLICFPIVFRRSFRGNCSRGFPAQFFWRFRRESRAGEPRTSWIPSPVKGRAVCLPYDTVDGQKKSPLVGPFKRDLSLYIYIYSVYIYTHMRNLIMFP